jgi:hypothetical protein
MNNMFRGPHPKLQQSSYPLPVTGQIIRMDATQTDWMIASDTAYIAPRLISGVLATSTLTDVQLKVNGIYEVANGATITLPLAQIVDSGNTKFVSDQGGSFTITPATGDVIIYAGTSYTAGIVVAANSVVNLTCMGIGKWIMA